MFTINKHELAIGYISGPGYVQEAVGEGSSRREASATAAREALRARREREYKEADRFSAAELFVYQIRSLWNPRIRQALRDYFAKLEAARIALDSPATCEIRRLPEQLSFVGQRLAIGQSIYMVDSYTGSLVAGTVTRERVNYYRSCECGVVYYDTTFGRTIRSDLDSGFSNIHYFVDESAARDLAVKTLEQRLANVQQQLNKTRG